MKKVAGMVKFGKGYKEKQEVSGVKKKYNQSEMGSK